MCARCTFVLSKLSEEDKKLRLHEAYYYTIGEIYARRAANNANRPAEELRDAPDETGFETKDGMVVVAYPAQELETGDAVAKAARTLAQELDAQPEQTRFNQSAFAGSRVDYNQPSLEAIFIVNNAPHGRGAVSYTTGFPKGWRGHAFL